MEKDQTNIYRRGADNGFLLGILFIVLFASMVMSEYLAFLSLIMAALFLSVPFVMFIFLRNSCRKAGYVREYLELWVEGIVTFACGGIILAMAVYVFMKFIDPEYIVRQVDTLLEVYRDIDDGRSREVVDLLKLIKENNAYPTPRMISVQLFMTTCFTGSILSMAIALLVKSLDRRK